MLTAPHNNCRTVYVCIPLQEPSPLKHLVYVYRHLPSYLTCLSQCLVALSNAEGLTFNPCGVLWMGWGHIGWMERHEKSN